MPDGSLPKDKPTPPKETLVPQKLAQGQVVFYDSQGNPKFGYEKGELNVPLPSGKSINIFVDHRITGQAEYSPLTKALVFPTSTAEQINNPGHAATEGWTSVDQKIDYFIRHEYNHMVWDNLDEPTKQQIIELMDHPNLRANTRAFGAFLISKKEYQLQQEPDPEVPCYEYNFAGETHRYSKELIINELFAHATIGQMMPREQVTQVQRNSIDRENFGLRSKTAIDLVSYVTKNSAPAAELLERSGLISSTDYDKDRDTIKTVISALVKK